MDFSSLLTPEMQALAMSLFALTGVRALLGIYAAVKDGTFVLSSVGAFVRSQVLGRVFPILTVALFASTSGNVALVAAAGATGAAYLAETVGAITEALSKTQAAAAAEKTVLGNEIGNPVPQD